MKRPLFCLIASVALCSCNALIHAPEEFNSNGEADPKADPNHDDPIRGDERSAGQTTEEQDEENDTPPPCGDTGLVIEYFESACASCHQGTRYPDLTRAGLAQLVNLQSQILPGERLLVPGDPEASFLYRKMAHTQGPNGGAQMPLGRSSPVSELFLIERWILDGALLACEEPVVSQVVYDPNTLDAQALFTCDDPKAPRSSPARLRRLTDKEFTRIGVNANGIDENPLQAPDSLPYSTYDRGVGIDSATLDLMFLHLPNATDFWRQRDPGGTLRRMHGIYNSDIVTCMHKAEISEECIERYVRTLLTRGALHREPRPDETSRLRGYLDSLLAVEASPADADERSEIRKQTLHEIAQAALLMTGALFKSDVGPGSDAGSHILSPTEIATMLGRVLTPAPVGTPISYGHWGTDHLEHDPDYETRTAGRLSLLAAAAADGSITDPDVRRRLFRTYASGISERRPDLELRNPDARGNFWLAPSILAFFREWLDYDHATTAFKDHPAETSRFISDGSQYDSARIGFAHLQSPASHLNEPNLVEQLDDVIARIVVETDESGQDVFRELLTSRRAFLAQKYPHRDENSASWPYGLDVFVEDNDESRWVEYPSDNPRMGVLTHPAWLVAHGGNFEDDASAIMRGYWLRTKLFCQSFGTLSDVQGLQAMLGESSPDKSARTRIRYATEPGADPSGDIETIRQCWGCHQYMNSLGYPFEAFNHAGYDRAEDHGGPPDSSTVVDNLPDPALNRSYGGVQEFVLALSESRYARRGMIRQAFRFFMGRDELATDSCTLAEMENALDETGSFLGMLEALVASDTFVMRSVTR